MENLRFLAQKLSKLWQLVLKRILPYVLSGLQSVLIKGGNGYAAEFFETGRLGHCIGLSLTEMPSVCKNEKTIIKEGVVLTLEPSIPLKDDKLLVHEECIAITKTGYELLTIRASKDFYYIQK